MTKYFFNGYVINIINMMFSNASAVMTGEYIHLLHSLK